MAKQAEVTFKIKVERSDGPPSDTSDVVDELRNEIDSLDLWVDESNDEVSVIDVDYPDSRV